MRTKLLFFLILLVLLYIPFSSLFTGEKTEPDSNAVEILTRVENVLHFPDGELNGRMMHMKPGGDARLYSFEVDVSGKDSLLKFSSDARGNELSVLFNKNEDIWEFDPVINKLSYKRWTGLMDTVFSTNFYFIDLSGLPLANNFMPHTAGDAVVDNIDCLKLELIPRIKEFRYGLLVIYIKKSDNIPVKIEFYNIDKKLFKIMTINNILKQNDKNIAMRYEMSDNSDGSSTIIEFYSYDAKKKFDKRIFKHENMGAF